LVLVDEMRFPSVFPGSMTNPEQFVSQYMPSLFHLWQHGVRFESYYSSGDPCSPARATILTGLYPHQQWLLATPTTSGSALEPGFPTYGKLLRRLGYQTPYFGKWHLSNPPAHGTHGYLELLRNPNAAGRDHVLSTPDEVLIDVLNYLHAPTHVLVVRTKKEKLVTYTKWIPGTTRPRPGSMQLEFYDYGTAEGRAETRSRPDEPRASATAHTLFARASYVAYVAKSNVSPLIQALEACPDGAPDRSDTHRRTPPSTRWWCSPASPTVRTPPRAHQLDRRANHASRNRRATRRNLPSHPSRLDHGRGFPRNRGRGSDADGRVGSLNNARVRFAAHRSGEDRKAGSESVCLGGCARVRLSLLEVQRIRDGACQHVRWCVGAFSVE
jgi:arylsulfatase A-like enzyme